jgi:hypothetical protein
MEKVVPFFKSYKSIFYLRCLEPGKISFGESQVWISFKFWFRILYVCFSRPGWPVSWFPLSAAGPTRQPLPSSPFLLPPDPPASSHFPDRAMRARRPRLPRPCPCRPRCTPSRCPWASPPQRRGLWSRPRCKPPLQAPKTRRAFARRRLRLPPLSSRARPPPCAGVPARATPSASTLRNRLRIGLRLSHAATRHQVAPTKLTQLPRPRSHASEVPRPCSPCRPQLLARRSRHSAMATSSSSERASPPWLSSRAAATRRIEPELLIRVGQDPELLPGRSPPQRHPSPSPSQQRAPAH